MQSAKSRMWKITEDKWSVFFNRKTARPKKKRRRRRNLKIKRVLRDINQLQHGSVIWILNIKKPPEKHKNYETIREIVIPSEYLIILRNECYFFKM